MNDYQVFSVITKKDLRNKGFVVHRKRNHPDAFYTKVTKGDVEGYIYFNDKNQVDIFPERDILLAQELCKAFPDIQIISDDQLCEYAHLTEEEQAEKFSQMVEETVGIILAYDPSQHKFEPMRDPKGNPIMPPTFELSCSNSPEDYQDNEDDECDGDNIVTNDNNKTMPWTQPLFK